MLDKWKARLAESSAKADERYEEHLKRKEANVQNLNKMSFAEVIGKYWFYLALLVLVLFPVMDVVNQFRSDQAPSLSRIFLVNGGLGLAVSLPVLLAYLWDYKTSKEWRDAAAKRLRIKVLLVLCGLWLLLGLVFLLLQM